MAYRMERLRKQKITRGAVLFAFNSPKFNYFKMAEFAAKRIQCFLKLPVTLVTDTNSLVANSSFSFDNIIIVEPDLTNNREWGVWLNKGRFRAYDLSPYDETLVMDVDYMVNSPELLKVFEFPTDFCCYGNVSYIMHPTGAQEAISALSFNTVWATVMFFKKTSRAKQIFD